MIKDKLINAETYYGITNNLKEGLIWLKNTNLNELSDGKYIINENIYANIQTYETKDNAPFEAHREYIDIQYMIDGKEKIGISDYSECKTKEKYNPEKDIEFLISDSKEYTTISNGEFVILFPQDAHQPSLDYDEKRMVKKAVVKVKI